MRLLERSQILPQLEDGADDPVAEGRLVRRAAGRHPGDEDALVVPLEGRGTQPAGDTQSQALVGSTEADLVDELLGFNGCGRGSAGVAGR